MDEPLPEPRQDAQQGSPAETPDELGLDDFRQVDDEGGLSIEALSAAYAELIGSAAGSGEATPAEAPSTDGPSDVAAELAVEDDVADRDGEVTARSILEAMLFVGNPDNQPLAGQQVAKLMRGVRAQEIDELVLELNAEYEEEGCPYRIASVGAGYVMQLCEEYRGLRDKFYGRLREARLSQAAVDVLAIVAYRQPLSREEVDRLRGRPSGAVLTQLVRRQLLRIERPEEHPRRPSYSTTDRFLELFGLEHLGELPQSQDIDRNF